MQCERCGHGAIKSEGFVLLKAEGPEATNTIRLTTDIGKLDIEVCPACLPHQLQLGWKAI